MGTRWIHCNCNCGTSVHHRPGLELILCVHSDSCPRSKAASLQKHSLKELQPHDIILCCANPKSDAFAGHCLLLGHDSCHHYRKHHCQFVLAISHVADLHMFLFAPDRLVWYPWRVADWVIYYSITAFSSEFSTYLSSSVCVIPFLHVALVKDCSNWFGSWTKDS